MKILLDARLYGLENAGLGRYTINLIEELKKIDKENDYIVLLRKKYFNELSFPKNWKKVLAEFRHYSLMEQVNLPLIISKEKPDLVHFLNFNIPIFYKGKFVVTIHDLLMKTHRSAKSTTLPFYLFYPKHFAAKYTMKMAIQNATKVIVPSLAIRDEVAEFYKIDNNKVKVVYEGVSHKPSYKLQITSYKYPYFLYVGNSYPHKNLERLIKAVVQLNEVDKRKALLLIASSRDIFTKRLQKEIDKIGASRYVKILGFVPDEELSALYRNSLAFIYPSLSEGFGLPGLEAMASGTIVAVSDIQVFKEIYKEIPLYFDPYSIDSIKNSLIKVLEMSSDKRNNLIQKGQELVKTYSWQKMAKETLEVYESFGLNK